MAGDPSYPNGCKWEELIGGRYVPRNPLPTNHALINGNLFALFGNYLHGKNWEVFPFGLTVFLTDEDHYVPDLTVVHDKGKLQYDGVHGAPDLVVEVISPGTEKRDRWDKKNGCEAAGVPELWLVDPLHRSVEVYLLQEGRYVLDNVYTLFDQEDLDMMTAQERAEVLTEFQCHLFDDFTIRLEDVFREWFQHARLIKIGE